jgi:hypothetical protein
LCTCVQGDNLGGRLCSRLRPKGQVACRSPGRTTALKPYRSISSARLRKRSRRYGHARSVTNQPA